MGYFRKVLKVTFGQSKVLTCLLPNRFIPCTSEKKLFRESVSAFTRESENLILILSVRGFNSELDFVMQTN